MGVSAPSRRRPARDASGKRLRKPRVLDGYKRLLVPIGLSPESERAMAVAVRIAAEHRASITALAVVEVPPLLPLDAHMQDEEAAAHVALGRAAAIADGHGVKVSLQTTRARDAADAIVAEILARDIELVVVSAARGARASKAVSIFGSTVEHVLKNAPCRVMVVGSGSARPSAA